MLRLTACHIDNLFPNKWFEVFVLQKCLVWFCGMCVCMSRVFSVVCCLAVPLAARRPDLHTSQTGMKSDRQSNSFLNKSMQCTESVCGL